MAANAAKPRKLYVRTKNEWSYWEEDIGDEY